MDAPAEWGIDMKILTPLGALLLAQTAVAAESLAVRPEVTVTPIPAPTHAIKQPWLDRALLRAKANADRLRVQRGDRPQLMAHTVELKWPVRHAINVTETQIQYLSMYVDQDDSGDILDWNCGDRTYNGHNGVDIGIGPYAWYRMRRDQGIAIAAALGVIVEKTDDFPEESCDTNQKDGNLIVIEHEDASLGIYAHIRTGSATHKEVGDPVYEGEYLGVIGSSGISSGPHLHFGVGFFEPNGNDLEFVHQDPWDGACNNIGGEPWWEDQPPALLPSIMDVATHSAQPTNPPCPQSEEPNFKSTFMPGDPITFSAVLHDIPANETADIVVRQPNGTVFVQSGLAAAAEDRLRANLVTFSTGNLPDNAMPGEWKLEVSFMGNTEVHSFWVNASRPAPPLPTLANNAYNGLWYDPGKSGEGYNIITSPNGTVIFFYGSDENGNRLWLLSELVTGDFVLNQPRSITMYESTGGDWESPIPSGRGLSIWGDLELTFSDCSTGTALLDGVDGNKLSNLTKLAAVPGTNCSSGAREDNIRSGLWYDQALTGEGFNFIVAPNGVVIFYYGFDADGERLWMHSDTLTPVQSIGAEVDGTMNRAMQGTFNTPVAGVLQDWGTINVKVNTCNSITITMDTVSGLKVSQTVRLAQVVGLGCP